jgi:hypothetical protein
LTSLCSKTTHPRTGPNTFLLAKRRIAPFFEHVEADPDGVLVAVSVAIEVSAGRFVAPEAMATNLSGDLVGRRDGGVEKHVVIVVGCAPWWALG